MGTDEQKQDIRLNQKGYLALGRNTQQLNVTLDSKSCSFRGKRNEFTVGGLYKSMRSSQAKRSIKCFYAEVSRDRSSEEVSVMEMERRVEFSELWSETGSRNSQKKKKKKTGQKTIKIIR